MPETLLPTNRTAFEEAFDLALARVGEIEVEIEKVVRPYEIPEALLPWLAWHLSVDLWRDEWPVEKKRVVTARSLPWHKRKGTKGAISEAIEIMGGEPRRYITPPGDPFLGRALTEEEREAFLARFAQLRVYPYVARSHDAKPGVHYRGPMWGFMGPIQRVDTRFTRTATLWDKGEEETLTIKTVTPETAGIGTAVEFDEVVIPKRGSRAKYFNQPPKAKVFFVDDASVRERIIRIPRSVDYEYRLGREQYTTVLPDADLIHVEPRLIAEEHPRQSGSMFFNGGAEDDVHAKSFLPPSIAWRHLFEQWHIHDPERAPDYRRGTKYFRAARFGVAPFTAEIQVRIKKKRHPRAVGRFIGGFFIKSPQQEIADVREGVLVAQSLRDKLLLDTKTYAIPTVGDRRTVGTLQIGQYIEV